MANRDTKLVLLLVMAICAVAISPGTTAAEVPKDAGTAYVAQDAAVAEQHSFMSFLNALKDQGVSSVVVIGNYSVHKELDGFVGPPLVIQRNLTISGYQGKETVLDLDFKRAMVELASNSSLTFENITIANERRGTGSQYDLFVGNPGSKVIARDVYKLRMACTDARHLAYVVSHTPRSKLFPGADRSQSFEFINMTYRGRVYNDSLKMIDYTQDVPMTLQEGAPPYGGYALAESNKVRLCQRIVSQECLDRASPDYCVNRAIDDMQAEAAATATARTQSNTTAGSAAGSHEAANPATAVIAAFLGGAGALALLGLLIWLRRQQHRKHLQALLRKGSLKPAPKEFFGESTSNGSTTEDIEAGVDEEGRVESDAWQPSGLRKGWEVSHCLSTPLIAAGENEDRVQFGRLLGCGSFGRVYLANWAGRQCAVKVITHGSNTTPVVENEVALMMAFNHPNIVRAYRCITYTHAPSSKGNVSSKPCGSTTDSGVEDSNYSSSFGQGLEGHGSRGLVRAVGVVRKQSSLAKDQLVMGSPGSVLSSSVPKGQVHGPAVALHSGDRRQPLELASAEGHAAAIATEVGPAAVVSRSLQVVQAALRASNSSVGRGVTSQGTPTDAARVRQTPVDGGRLTAGSGGTGSLADRGTDFSSTDADEDPDRAETWLIQEYCDCGTLSSLLCKWQAPADSAERLVRLLVLLQDTARGLEELHQANVVHGDLNARNVLVSSSSTAPYGHTAKIADLGLSRTVKQHQTHRTTNTVGTMSHMPPELLRYGRMSNAADVYAFGIMMWEVYTGQQAFRRLHYGQFFDIVVRHNLRPSVPDQMPSDYRTLMEHCWATEAADRPTCSSIVDCLEYMILERKMQLQPIVPQPFNGDVHAVDQHGSIVDGSAAAARVGGGAVAGAAPVVSQLRTVISADAVENHASSNGSMAAAAAAAGPGGLRNVLSAGAADVAAAAAAAAAALGVSDMGHRGHRASAGGAQHDQARVLTPKKPHLLSRPAPLRRPRISFGYYGSPAAAAATPQAAAAAAAAADSDDLAAVDDRQLYLPIDEACALAITPTAATPVWGRNPGQHLPHQQEQTPSGYICPQPAAEGRRTSFSLFSQWPGHSPGEGRRTSFSLLLSQLPSHFAPLFRSQTADHRRSSYSRRASVESGGMLDDVGSQLSDPLPTSFTSQRDDSQVSKRSWFV